MVEVPRRAQSPVERNAHLISTLFFKRNCANMRWCTPHERVVNMSPAAFGATSIVCVRSRGYFMRSKCRAENGALGIGKHEKTHLF